MTIAGKKKPFRKKATTHISNVEVADEKDLPGPEYARPQEDWSTSELKKYGLARLADAERHEGSALLALARAGEAFVVVRDRLKPKHGWTGWLKALGVRRQRAWKAIKVHEGASREAAQLGLAIEEVIRQKTYTQAMEAWARGEGTGEDEGGSKGAGEGRKSRPEKKTLAAIKGKDEPEEGGEEVEPNGNIQIAGGTAFVRCGLLSQVSECDGWRELLVVRNWDARTKAALGRQVAVLVVPELDDRCLPVAKEGGE